MKVRIVEGYWICPKCNTRCRGADQDCDNCGAVRTADVKFHLDKGAPAITDAKELELARSGPDWICGFCGNTSPAGEKNCTGCGSLRSDGTKRQTGNKPETPDGGGKIAKEVSQTPAKPEVPRKPISRNTKIGCGMFLLLLVLLMIVDSFEKPGKIEVKQTFWERTIEREQYQSSRSSDWHDRVPSNAIIISRSSEIRRYNSIPDGYEEFDEDYTVRVQTGEREVEETIDLGNGRFEIRTRTVPEYESETRTRRVRRQKYRKEPVFDEKVTFDVLDWELISRVTATGSNSLPEWPDTKAVTRDPPQEGDIKERKRKEYFSISVLVPGETTESSYDKIDSKPITCEQFIQLEPGTVWDVTFSGLGRLVNIKGLSDKSLQ
ncbi:MAG: hypothetical protein CVV41_00195 [Candidatus Riflebacteria bacterium HGW-Riflebacteria-1]|nr:MAG: hypothetical protein CVV41_00195 [Candidatus Riflebacteria bacterium HGW-Riflebacteria-1]